MSMRSFRDEILNERNIFSYTMLSRLAGPDRDQDQESTSVTLTMNVCDVELLIRSKGLMCPSEKSNQQFFPEEFNKKKYHNRKKYYN